MPATMDWIKKNVPKGGAVGALFFMPGYVKELTTAENKLKAIVKITADWLTWTLKLLSPLRTYIISGALVKGFIAVGDAIKGIVRSTGSLTAALERLKAVQFSQQQLAPLVGGMAAAKQRVAELITLSAKGPFKFEEIAAANRNLEVFTRGVFSSAKATQMIGQVAMASGNQIEATAEAAGQLYQNLREGRSIEGAVENLRQMGIVSDEAGQNLIKMARAGATTTEIFNTFTSSMQTTAEGLGDVSDNLKTVTAEHEKAADAMKVAFGAPWTAAEVQNTKNMTAAMIAITPAVAKISSGFAILYNGMSTFRTSVTRAIAELPIFQKALELVGATLQVVLGAAVLFGTVGLVTLIPKISGMAASLATGIVAPLMKVGVSFTTATQSAIIFGNVLRGAAAVTIGAGIISGLAAIAGTVISAIQAMKESEREAARMTEAFKKSDQAIREQISSATTLAERHEALARAMNSVASAQDELIQKQKEGNTWWRSFMKVILQTQGVVGHLPKVEVDAAKAALKGRKATELEAARMGTAGLSSEERRVVMTQARERARVMQEEEFQERISVKTGAGRARELEARAAVLGGRATAGEAGKEERARLAEVEAERKRQIAQQFGKGQDKQRQDALNKLQVEMLGRREFAPAGTSVQYEAAAERQRHAIRAGTAGISEETKAKELALSGGRIALTDTQREAANLEARRLEDLAEEAKYNEENNVQLKEQTAQLQRQAVLEREAYALTLSRITATEKISSLRGTSAQKAAEEYKARKKEILEAMDLERSRTGGERPEVMRELAARLDANKQEEIERVKGFETTKQETDLQLGIRVAKREGRSQDMVALQHQEAFMQRFQQHRSEGLDDEEARRQAMAETEEDIRGRVIPGGPAAVVSSLQEIGGGGGIYAPGGDPALQTQKQIIRLTETANAYLKIIAQKGEGVK